MTETSDVFFQGWLLGVLVTGLIFGVISYPSGTSYKTILREARYLIEQNNGIITPTDLTLRAEISPGKAKKFLKKLARELDAEVEVNEEGLIYYKFTSAKMINSKLLKG
ncbi:MAG: hypothetical protein QNJ54_25165 [Prochloraceae cyanobacterium]|nr:hypothetical protein [Prochloraceae cyanobacterium]